MRIVEEYLLEGNCEHPLLLAHLTHHVAATVTRTCPDILIGIGLPWTAFLLFHPAGHGIQLNSVRLNLAHHFVLQPLTPTTDRLMQSGTWHSVLALLAAIFYLMIVLVCSGFHLSRPAGTALLTGYLGYLVYLFQWG